MTLVLAPSSPRGWFGGRAFAARDPVDIRTGLGVREAGDALEAAFAGDGPPVVAALVTYEGEATVLAYGVTEAAPVPAPPMVAEDAPLVLEPSMSPEEAYRTGVERVRERITAGDVYVLNLTHAVTGRAVLPPAETFAALLARAGSAMSAYLETPGVTLASVSPERFLRVRASAAGRTAEVCPIKGTRPRGATPEADAAYAAELLADPKERAEHVMVVDLERNDLGRVCEPGTIEVDPLFEVVPTPYCHQLVSTVRGRLCAGARFADLLEATFPCGSVTGAPKFAAMRIAAELEDGPRGPYCGALLVAVPGELDSCVLIRTAELSGGHLRWGTGCGIVYDSDPGSEWRETLLKAWPVLGGQR